MQLSIMFNAILVGIYPLIELRIEATMCHVVCAEVIGLRTAASHGPVTTRVSSLKLSSRKEEQR